VTFCLPGSAFNVERKEKRREKESVKKEKTKGKKRRIETLTIETNEVWESENDCMRCK